MQVQIPEISESSDRAEVARLLVEVGEAVDKEQPLCELESDKASVELPSPCAGTVEQIHVTPGDEVRVGQLAFTIRDGAPARPTPSRHETPPSEEPTAEAAPPARPPAPPIEAERQAVRAAPSTRRLARELGVDLQELARGGQRLSRDDVTAYVRARPPESGVAEAEHPEQGDERAAWGPVSRQRLSRLRRTAAKRLLTSWQTIPHVTQHELCDVTDVERARQRHLAGHVNGETRLTLTAIVGRAAVAALEEHPSFNASLDDATEELVLKHYVNLGIAVDTDRGLLVPVVRDAHTMTLAELARAIDELATAARAGSLEPHQLAGGSFTITNLGGIGGAFFTPILPPDQVAILGLSRARRGMYADNGDRLLLPLSLSYDHRVIDGADAVRFLNRICELVSEPLSLLMVA